MTVLGRVRVPRAGEAGGAPAKKKPPRRESASQERERERLREERRRLLRAARSPERQTLRPRDSDALHFLPLGQFVIIAGCIVIFISGLFALNYLAQNKNQLGADVSRLTREQQRLMEENLHLKARIERLTALDDLEIIARENLGLSMPSRGQIVVLEPPGGTE
jgi:cell division protein FtsL